MKICKNCGKEVAGEFKYCNSCGTEIEEGTDENVEIQPTENTVEQSNINEYQNVQPAESNDEYLPLISNSKIINLISIGLLVAGVISLLFINGWLGAVLCFVAEIVALIPNTKVQKLFKSKNSALDKNTFKANQKTLQNDLKAKSKDFKLSFLLALIALVLLVVFVVANFAITSWADSLPVDLQKDSYGSGIVEQIDTISDLYQYSNTDMYNNSRDDEADVSKEPIEAVDNAYYPTVDEFIKDYTNLYSSHVATDWDVSCRTESSGDKVTIYVSFNDTEYMSIECTVREDGKIQQVSSKVNYGLYNRSHYIDDESVAMTLQLAEVTLPSFIILDYQHGHGLSGVMLAKSKELSKELLASAYNNKITDTYYSATKTYDNCAFTFSVSLETASAFHCSCTIFPKNDEGVSNEKTTEKNESTQNSSTQSSAPVIGEFSYNLTYDSTTKTLTDPVYPYFTNLRFKADGTCVVTVVVETGDSGSAEGVWELSESECRDTMLVYRLQVNNGGESMPIYYDTEVDSCMILGAGGTAYHYQRYTSDK